jgi:predicted restriction endonuclease
MSHPNKRKLQFLKYRKVLENYQKNIGKNTKNPQQHYRAPVSNPLPQCHQTEDLLSKKSEISEEIEE